MIGVARAYAKESADSHAQHLISTRENAILIQDLSWVCQTETEKEPEL